MFEELSFPSSDTTTASGLTAGTLDDVEVVSPPSVASAEGHRGGFGFGLEDDREGGGVNLFHMGDHTKKCCGVIGGTRGTTFCTLPVGACKYKAHDNKASVLSDTLYVCTGRKNQARLFPRVSTTTLPKKWDLKAVVKEKKPFSVWAVFMEQAKELENVKVETVVNKEEEVEFDYTLKSIAAAKDAFKTPAKPTLGHLLSDLVDASPSGDFDLVDIKPFVDDVSVSGNDAKLLIMIEHWNDLVNNVKTLDGRMKRLKTTNHNYQESFQKVIDGVLLHVDKNQEGLQHLNSQVGMEESYDFDTFNVRDWIKILQEDVNKLEQKMTALEFMPASGDEEINVERRLQGIEEMIELQQDGAEELEAAMNEQFAAVQRTFVNLQQAGVGGKPGPGKMRKSRLGRNVNNGTDAGLISLWKEVKVLQAELEELKEVVDHPTFPTIREENQEEDDDDNEKDLGKRVKELETRLGEQGFSGGDEVFASFSDVKQWVVAEQIESSSIFWDLLSVLIAMEPTYMSGKEFADAEYSSARIKSTALETDLSASMKQHRPRILFAGSKKGFGACATYKEWIGGAESFKSEVGELVKGFRGGVRNCIMLERGEWSDRGCSLALELLSGVRDQWSELVSFIDSFYQLLTDVANFSPQKAWALVGRCVATVFTAMRTHREKVFKMRDDGSSKNRANIIWAVLQCHRVMNDFIKVDFKGHPLIVQAINTFMITERVDPEIINKALDRMKTLEADKQKLTQMVSKLEEVVAALSRSHKDLANEVKQLKKK